jgi:hypothetical protein
MPWVRRHTRRVPYGWGRTSVRSHYRRSPGGVSVVTVVVAVIIILMLIALF